MTRNLADKHSAAMLGLAVAALATPALAAPALAAPDISGPWKLDRPFQASILTAEGKTPPLKPEAQSVYRERIAARRAGKTKDGVEVCLPPGTPRILWADRPMVILQQADKITFVHEYQHTFRHIYLDEALPPAEEIDPTFGGTSAGRWDGDVLVIETVGFNQHTQLDQAGLPHSPDMKVTERLRLVQGGRRLEDTVTIDDPATYRAPWTTRVTFARAPGTALKEDICARKLLDPALRRPKR